MIILASGSSYRKKLLSRLQLSFTTQASEIDETPQPGEAPADLCARLSREKAEKIAHQYPEAHVIGSDQVAVLGTDILGKPGTEAVAKAQLSRCSGRRVTFLTGLHLISPGRAAQADVVSYFAQFRQLKEAEIDQYIAKDQPLDCAGSFKWESLGISLFDHLEGSDPTALEGLPLIKLSEMLRQAGLDPLLSADS